MQERPPMRIAGRLFIYHRHESEKDNYFKLYGSVGIAIISAPLALE